MTVKMIKMMPLTGLLLLAFLASTSQAEDQPKRKSGLWEIKTQMAGMPDMGASQECVDQNSDNFTQQGVKEEGVDCKPPDIKRSSDTLSIHTECAIEKTTVVSIDYLLKGSLDSAYKGTVKTQTKSPQGKHETSIALEARWLGPCKPGQKPGDVSMPQ